MVVIGGHSCQGHHPESQLNCLLAPSLQISVFARENTSTEIYQIRTLIPSSPEVLLMNMCPNNEAIIFFFFFFSVMYLRNSKGFVIMLKLVRVIVRISNSCAMQEFLLQSLHLVSSYQSGLQDKSLFFSLYGIFLPVWK